MTTDEQSEQIREVYAHYGLAMYYAQVLETEAWIALSMIKESDPSVITSWRFEEALEEAAALTMGQAVAKLIESAEVAPPLQQMLPAAVEKRNWLAHRYFWDRCVELANERGRAAMIDELAELADWFQEMDMQLSALTRRMTTGRGIALTDDAIELHLSKLLSGMASPTSTRRKLRKTETLVKVYRYTCVDSATGTSTTFPLFQLSDCTFCSLCHCGLTYGPESVDPDRLTPLDDFDDLLPAEVTIKPKGASNWNFRIPLGTAAEICVEPISAKAGVVFRWYVRRDMRVYHV